MKKKNNETKNIRLIDIARIANVSIGTVDRVIHNRGRVSEETKERVKEAMANINYKPNPVAQILSIRKKRTIGVLIPQHKQGDYWAEVDKGVTKAEKEISDFGFTIERLRFDRHNIDSFIEQIENIKQLSDISGFVISPQYQEKSIELTSYLQEQDIPYIFIDSNIEICKPLSYFGIHSSDAGVVLARLTMDVIREKEDILIANFQKENTKRATQVDLIDAGFQEYLKKFNFHGEIHKLFLDPDNKIWEKQFIDYINKNPRIKIAVVFNSLSHHLAKVKRKHKIDKLEILGFDLTEKNIPHLQKGDIKVLISQRPEKQGYQSVKTLCQYLAFPSTPIPEICFMPIDIIVKENALYYQEL